MSPALNIYDISKIQGPLLNKTFFYSANEAIFIKLIFPRGITPLQKSRSPTIIKLVRDLVDMDTHTHIHTHTYTHTHTTIPLFFYDGRIMEGYFVINNTSFVSFKKKSYCFNLIFLIC